MARETILIVDDEEDIVELIAINLMREGYRTLMAHSGERALELIASENPDLVVLDLMLPGVDGIEVTRRLRGELATERLPILMLTAKGEESDVVKGLDEGADDYVTKPFSPKILIARIRTLLRRSLAPDEMTEEESLFCESLELHTGRHDVRIDGAPLSLTFSEFQILALLMRRPGWVFTRGQIVDAVHGENYSVTDRSVDVQIVGLRKKLGEYGERVETVRGVGYRFREGA